MNTYSVTLLGKQPVARETEAFFFDKPQNFTFSPGQFISIRLPGDPLVLPKRGKYDFSLAGSGDEDELCIVTRMRESPFKHHLASLKTGDTVTIEGPYGTMVPPMDQGVHIVLLAGGMGIVPFRSMIHHSVTQHVPNPITLFHSNRTRAHAVFFDELRNIAASHPRIRFIPVMTNVNTGDTSWAGEKGYFTHDLLCRYLAVPLQAVYYIVGPVKMVIATKRTVIAMGIAEESIHMEVFTGY